MPFIWRKERRSHRAVGESDLSSSNVLSATFAEPIGASCLLSDPYSSCNAFQGREARDASSFLSSRPFRARRRKGPGSGKHQTDGCG